MGDSLDPAGIAVFFAVASGVVSLSMTQPRQWGIRRLALGVATSSAAIALLILSYSPWWWTGLMWGPYQAYVGWAYIHRRSRIAAERFEYIHSTAQVLSYIALSDGEISDVEIDIIRATYARAGFSDAELREVSIVVRECDARFREQGSDSERLFVLLKDACSSVSVHSNHQTRHIFLRTALLIASSDGFVSRAENQVVRAAALWLGLSASDVDNAWAQLHGDSQSAGGSANPNDDESNRAATSVPPDLATYYASILEVELTATPTELKRAYREKAKIYHPDLVAHRGPEFARIAEEKFKEVLTAYEFLRSARAT
jgi:DnaJ-domain-containing protein 1